MNDNTQLTTAAEFPGMDFKLLRQQGLAFIQQLSQANWTDYNSHDPGVTILEQLCYAITDLSYRLSFSMEELLADNPTPGFANPKQFFSPREILCAAPLTLQDYRKLLLDVDGVRNAWLTPLEGLTRELSYDPKTYQLYIDYAADKQDMDQATRFAPINKINGLYQVAIDYDETKGLSAEQVLQAVSAKLQANRNLAEDYYQIRQLSIEEVTVKANLTLDDNADPEQIMAELYANLSAKIAPTIKFYSLTERLAAGASPEEIFNGPALTHGFIDDAELAALQKPSAIHGSDIIEKMLNVPGVKLANALSLSSNLSRDSEQWFLPLSLDHTPRLKSLDAILAQGDFILYKNQKPLSLDPLLVRQKWLMLQAGNSRYTTLIQSSAHGLQIGDEVTVANSSHFDGSQLVVEIVDANQFKIGQKYLADDSTGATWTRLNLNPDQALRTGTIIKFSRGDEPITAVQDKNLANADYRELLDYTSIQTHFPVNYGVSAVGLPESASEERKARAKQLKAFLTLFDQLLGNYFNQLAYAKNLLAVGKNSQQEFTTYLARSVATNSSVPEVEELVAPELAEALPGLLENAASDSYFQRNNRLLDHVLARFGEQFTDNSLLLAKQNSLPTDYLTAKRNFLASYAELSYGRNLAANYYQYATTSPVTLAGFHRRIAALLNIDQTNIQPLADKEGFHLVEHILLRPNDEARLAIYPRVITSFKLINSFIVCTSIEHGISRNDMSAGKIISLILPGAKPTNYLLQNVPALTSKDTFVIEASPSQQAALLAANYGYWQPAKVIDVWQPISKAELEGEHYRCQTSSHLLQAYDLIKLKTDQEHAGLYQVKELEINGELCSFTISANGITQTPGAWRFAQPTLDFKRRFEAPHVELTYTTPSVSDLKVGDTVWFTNAGIYDGAHQVIAVNNGAGTFAIVSPWLTEMPTGATWSKTKAGKNSQRLMTVTVSKIHNEIVKVTADPADLAIGDTIWLLNTGAYPGAREVIYVAKEHGYFLIASQFEKVKLDLNAQWSKSADGQGPRINDLAKQEGVYCKAPAHGLYDDDKIQLLVDNTLANELQTVLQHFDKDRFSLALTDNKLLLKANSWLNAYLAIDPYSFIISLVVPRERGRFTDAKFRSLFESVVATEIPAYVRVNIVWVDEAQLKAFETLYFTWLSKLATNTAEKANLGFKLLQCLNVAQIQEWHE